MRRALALLLVPVVGGLLAACSSEGRSEEETAKAYISALNDRDPKALVALAVKAKGLVGLEGDAEEIIAKDGGRGLKITDMKVTTPTSSEAADVDVSGTDKAGKPFTMRVYVSREGDARDWTINLGRYEGTPKSNPAETSK
ncbi:hypothetical protein ACFRJ1_14330 [Streptomyces sp. NPDC056773]|uniref:hypothetical protein n=1 Tax=unclassified Streptomyces TaxID=2593676 RepID=UPI0036BB75BF